MRPRAIRVGSVAFAAVVAMNLDCHSHSDDPAKGSPAPAASVAHGSPPIEGGVPCGEMACTQFDTPEAAFRAAIASLPRVLAIGEAHAQKGATVPSSAHRFKETLLPVLKGRATDSLVELMNPPPGCLAQAAAVKKQQEVVTSHQAATDQNEYVAMGEAARALGIVPDLLRPTCADMDAIRDAGDDAIEVSLSTIARLTAHKVIELVDRDDRSPSDAEKMVVTYGGSIDHDRLPPKEREAWAFGPEVDARVSHRYVELDLLRSRVHR